MQITHEEAIQLIELNADKALHTNKEKLLAEHLKDCMQCLSYAHQLSETENVLQHVMRKQWNQRPAPLSTDALKAKKESRKNRSALLVTRTAFISIAFFALIFIGWQVAATNNPRNRIYAGIMPAPTPSMQYTVTTSLSLDCRNILYKVRENETLASIANQHAVSKEIIMNLNNMNTEAIKPSMELLIPICNSTPTSTIRTPTFTITPILESVTYTPG